VRFVHAGYPAGDMLELDQQVQHLLPSAHAVAEQQHAAPSASAEVVVKELIDERNDWQGRYTGLAAPMVLTTIGSLGLAAGFGMEFVRAVNDSETSMQFNTAATVTLITSAVLLATGITLLALRTSASLQKRELRRIDERLRAFGVDLALTPWLAPARTELGGLSGGLVLSGRI
jgi:hypothetical protein